EAPPPLGSRVTSGQVNPTGPHHLATCSGSVIASNTRCGEASTMRESLTVSWAATDAMVVLMYAFTLRAPAYGEVNPPIDVETASWSKAGQLDWWKRTAGMMGSRTRCVWPAKVGDGGLPVC